MAKVAGGSFQGKDGFAAPVPPSTKPRDTRGREQVRRPRFKAVAFDYFVLFDANSVVEKVEKEFPERGLEFTKMWRAKQFEYGFLRSITSRYRDFFDVTGDALDYTAEAMHLRMSPEARSRLMNAYLTLKPWPDTVEALKKLRAAGVRIITIANFSPHMLRRNAEHAGITWLIDVLLSTEENRTYKPDPRAYELGMKKLHLRKSEIAFAAFGPWDAYGAKSFGYPTFWVNRFGLLAERLGTVPDGESRDMQGLLEFVLVSRASARRKEPMMQGGLTRRWRRRRNSPETTLARVGVWRRLLPGLSEGSTHSLAERTAPRFGFAMRVSKVQLVRQRPLHHGAGRVGGEGGEEGEVGVGEAVAAQEVAAVGVALQEV